MRNRFALALFHVQMSDTTSRVLSRAVKGLIVAITLLSITPQAQGATTTVREIIKDPAIFYRARTMPYYLCEDPSDCVARYDAIWESWNPNRDIEIFNPQPDMDRTVNGKTISITYGAKITTELGTTIRPHRALDLDIIVRCPLKENGTRWQYRAITGAPHSTGVCVLRLPNDQVRTCPLGNPIFPEAQLKYQREEDYISQSGLLDFVRTFRSDTGNFGSQLDIRRVDVTGLETNGHCDLLPYDFPSSSGGRDIFYYCFKDASWGGTEYLQLVDSTGNYTFFDASLDPDNPTSNPSITAKPQRVTDTNGNTSWQVVQGNHIERYNAQGELLDKRFADGRFVTYTYSNEETPTSIAPRPGLKIAAQDPWGREIGFNYNADGMLSLFTDPSGELIQYQYGENNELINAVEYPDGSMREYFWNEPTLAPNPIINALTGIEYENGARSRFGYNAAGRAISTERAGGVDKWVLSPGYNRVTVTDPLGTERRINTTNLHGTVFPTSRSQPAGAGCNASSASLSYDDNGNIASKTDFNGTTTTYSYDLERNLETRRTEASATPSAQTTSTEWHPDWRLKVREAQPKRITTWVYNGQPDQQTGAVASCAPANAEVINGVPIAVMCKRIVQSTLDENGSDGFNTMTTGAAHVWHYTYNRYGKVLTSDGPRSDLADHWQYAYWSDSAVCLGASEGIGMDKGCRGELSRVTNPLGHETEYLKYNAHGQLLETRTQNNLLTRYTYDQRQRLIEQNVGGQITGFEYDPRGLLVRAVPHDSQPIVYTYDDAGRLTRITQEATGEYLQYTLDNMGNHTAEHIYDSNGLLLRNNTKSFDALSRLAELSDSVNQSTGYEYDAVGNLTKETNAKLNATAMEYNAHDRLNQITDALNGLTQYQYDAQDNLISVTDPNGLSTTYTHDGLGNLTQLTSPDTGITTYTYDEAGNRLTQTDARGLTTRYEYDTLNRLTAIHYPDTSLDVSYTYDQGVNGLGHLTTLSDANGTTGYNYNAYGNLLSQTRTSSDGIVTTFDYAYDNHGRLASLTYPSGNSIQYAYDTVGQLATLTHVQTDGTTQTLVNNIQFQPFGPIQAFDYGNGLNLSRTFDQDYHLISQQIPGILDNSYIHNPVGNISDWFDLLDTNRDQQFVYDALDRLTLADGDYGSLGYSYDATGNRLTKTEGMDTETYTYAPDSHQLLQILGSITDTRHYDEVGNTLSGQSGNFDYDDSNRLIRFSNTDTLAEYAYNGKGERVSKTVDGVTTRFRYGPDGQLLGEYDQAGQMIREYAYLEGQPVALLQNNNNAPVNLLQSINVNHNPVVVDLGGHPAPPVVIASPLTYNGGQGAVVALSALSESQVSVSVQEWDYLDGAHATEAVSLLALPPGRYPQADGSIWEVGRFTLSGTRQWHSINFSEAFTSTPYLFLSQQSRNDPEVTSVRARNVDANGFQAFLQEQESLNDGHGEETIGYLAIYSPNQGGTANLYGRSLSYQLNQMTLNHTWTAYGDQQLLLQEERSNDTELGHATETLDILELEGHLFAQDVTTAGWDSMALRRQGPTPEGILSGTPEATTLAYLHTDHLGSVVKATDENQAIIWDAVRKPFGERMVTTAQIEMPLGFPGQYFDQETRLSYN